MGIYFVKKYKSKVVRVHSIKAHRKNGSIAPLIPMLGINDCKWLTLYPGTSPLYMKPGVPETRSGRLGGEESPVPAGI